MKFADQVETFIIRRAFRATKVVRNDLMIAFAGAIKEVRASQLLSETVSHCPGILLRKGNAVVRHPNAETPLLADEDDLMSHIFSGRTELSHTGLYSRELPIQQVAWINNHPQKSGAFTEIVQSLRQKKCLQIEYISLNQHDRGQTRVVQPVGLQQMADQWRLIAYDLNKVEPYQQAFVLARIRFAKMLEQKATNKLAGYLFESIVKIPVELNRGFTPDQKETLEHELGIQKNHITLPKAQLFEYLRRFSEIPTSDSAVWPMLKTKADPDG
ncbi:MAG: WYL domain-containing protein [Pseudomonadales bacterium]|nr:WYL domain-containing protein [Pseudomonadales bacterium]